MNSFTNDIIYKNHFGLYTDGIRIYHSRGFIFIDDILSCIYQPLEFIYRRYSYISGTFVHIQTTYVHSLSVCAAV